MKKTLVSLLVIIAFSGSALATWGPTGHRVTGHIAEMYLTKKARKAINRMLAGESLAMASNWMDEVRSDRTFDHMTDWHWVAIPYGSTYDQTTLNPKGDIIATLERVVAELKSGTLGEAEQAERIRILVHLVGDIHQPLHVGGRDDRGGNDVKVKWFGSASNLHRVWDSEMIDGTRLSYTEMANSLRTPGKEEIKNWQHSSVRDWARESQSFEKQVYDIGEGRLGYEYNYKYLPIVRERLLMAGVRIAGILNDIYG